MLCVSNKQGRQFLEFLVCAACIFILAVFLLFACVQGLSSSAKAGYKAHFLRAKTAWHETGRRMATFVVLSCVLLSLYSNAFSLACTVVSDHLRLHFIALRKPVEVILVVSVHLWIYQSAARFQGRHATGSMIVCHGAPYVSTTINLAPKFLGRKHILMIYY
eukprot:4973562-Amphidinium_carterae.1